MAKEADGRAGVYFGCNANCAPLITQFDWQWNSFFIVLVLIFVGKAQFLDHNQILFNYQIPINGGSSSDAMRWSST